MEYYTAVHVSAADMHMFCPKGHRLISRIAPVTQIPAFCNFCFQHVIQSSWAGDIKYCAVDACHYTICASCLTNLAENSENIANLHCCVQHEAMSSLKVR
jgi:hypothetical protein